MQIDNRAFDYDRHGQGYSAHRETDPRIAAFVHQALEDARTIVNVGAGAGSYEPGDRYVMAVEPSEVMRRQRLQKGKVPALDATAEKLPFDDDSFDAAMAMVTVHHWPDIARGLAEMRRVARGPVVVMTFDPAALGDFWNAAYFPEVIRVEAARYPSIDSICAALGGQCSVQPISIPLDCRDGFQEAFYGRPEAFLEKEVRLAQSAWGFIAADEQERIVDRLRRELADGSWDRKYGHFRNQETFTGALRLVVSRP